MTIYAALMAVVFATAVPGFGWLVLTKRDREAFVVVPATLLLLFGLAYAWAGDVDAKPILAGARATTTPPPTAAWETEPTIRLDGDSTTSGGEPHRTDQVCHPCRWNGPPWFASSCGPLTEADPINDCNGGADAGQAPGRLADGGVAE